MVSTTGGLRNSRNGREIRGTASVQHMRNDVLQVGPHVVQRREVHLTNVLSLLAGDTSLASGAHERRTLGIALPLGIGIFIVGQIELLVRVVERRRGVRNGGESSRRRRGQRSRGSRLCLRRQNDEVGSSAREGREGHAQGLRNHRAGTSEGRGEHDERERIEVVVVMLLGRDSVADRLETSDQMERCCLWSISSEQPRWSDKNQTILCGHWVLHIWDTKTMNLM